MPRALADALFSRLLDAFPVGTAYAPDDFGAPMPPPVAHFLTQTLRERAQQAMERWRPPASPYLDTAHPDVEDAAAQYRAALLRHAHLPADDWRDALRNATRRVAAYLTHPVRTAVRYVFQGDDGALPVADIVQRMHHLAPYPYLREAVSAYAEQRGLREIDRTSLTALLTRMDQRMTADYTPEAWHRLLDPLFGAARVAYADEGDGIPTALLTEFFVSKKARAVARRLETAEQDGAAWTSEAALRRLLESASEPPAPEPSQNDRFATARPSDRPQNRRERAPEERPHGEQPREEQPREGRLREDLAKAPRRGAPSSQETPSSQEAPSSREADRSGSEAPGERSAPQHAEARTPPPEQDSRPYGSGGRSESSEAPAVPLWKQFQQRSGSGEAESPAAAQQEARNAQDRPRWQQFQSPSERAQPSARPDGDPAESSNAASGPARSDGNDASSQADATRDLAALERDVLGRSAAQSRSRFVRQLFGGDEDAYAQVLQRLRQAPTWSDASRIIARDVFRERQVNIYSEPAVAFTDAVEARFR